MKKILSLTLALIMIMSAIFCFASCGGEADDNTLVCGVTIFENMNEKDMSDILREALYEFPVLEVKVNMPEWIAILNHNHYLKKEYILINKVTNEVYNNNSVIREKDKA